MMKYNYDNIRNDYLTPPEIFEKIEQLFGINDFDLDVCCTQKNVPAEHHYIEDEVNGLVADWKCFNYCNPPFEDCKKWVQKAYQEQQKGRTTVMLIPARTETEYFHKYILNKDDVIVHFLRKGLRFLDPDTKEPMGVFKNALCLVLFKGGVFTN